ncbi:MAG: Tim44/TimA family putative adaptor protein [Pseudomonadota bacterium]
MIEILFFAAIAAVILLRLRSVLGRRTGHEAPPMRDPFGSASQDDEAPGKVVRLPRREVEADPEVEAEDPPAPRRAPASTAPGVDALIAEDASFDPAEFVDGARGAFEIIVGAFAAGAKDELRPLLSDEVMRGFAQAIDERNERDETLETTLVGFKDAAIEQAEVQGRTAFVTVRFETEQVNVTKDSESRIVDGDPSAAEVIIDVWTFARNLKASDPNWMLVSTEAPDDDA